MNCLSKPIAGFDVKLKPLTLLIASSAFISSPSYAELIGSCSATDQTDDQRRQIIANLQEKYPKLSDIIVESDHAEMERNVSTEFIGNVIIFQQQQIVQADYAVYDETNSTFEAKGNVDLSSNAATVRGESIFIDDINKDFILLDADYQFGFNDGRGKAKEFSIENNQKLKLEEATFTTCPGENPSWVFASNNIFIDQDKGWGEAWNTVFKIKDVPIVFLPYITFPITDQRKSGLLFPEFGNSSRYGAYYAQPIYLNLDTNMDATITPKYMSDRGWLLQNNFRYLTESSYNVLQLEYLNEDKNQPDLGERFLAYWQHESDWAENWHLQIQWTDLSDDNYISEFNSDYHHQADTHLNNFVHLRYATENLQLSFQSQDIYELGPHLQSYKVPIQMQADWRVQEFDSGFNINLMSQYSHFRQSQRDITVANRFHFEPSVQYEYYSPGFQFETSASYLSTHYRQEYLNDIETKEIDRGLFKYRLLTGLTFEKLGRFFGQDVRQTVEPKIQYVYVEESQQSEIGLFDTQLLKEDYYALFRDTAYSGLDRIAAMNQATIGFSTSIFDNKNAELLRLGIGQVHRFDDSLGFDGTNQQETDSKPALAFEFFGQISQNWQLDGGFLYNRDTKEVDTGFAALDYYLSADKNIQINHRYARDLAGIKINQTGFFASYKINPNWSVAASYHYDSEREVNLDSLIGFEYRACCWSIKVSAQRQVRLDLNSDIPIDNSDVEYENSIGISFSINGLGGEAGASVAKMFNDSIFAYRRPYLITN